MFSTRELIPPKKFQKIIPNLFRTPHSKMTVALKFGIPLVYININKAEKCFVIQFISSINLLKLKKIKILKSSLRSLFPRKVRKCLSANIFSDFFPSQRINNYQADTQKILNFFFWKLSKNLEILKELKKNF